LIKESNQRAATGRQMARLERKKKQAEAMGEKQEARETGEDLERKRAWDYSIEDNENWDKKQEKKGRRADTGFAGKTRPSWGGAASSGRC
jgi:pre-mRNA-splicing factor SYF2